MGVFAKYRRFYREPERISPESARLNRINSALAREAEFRSSLSPVTDDILERSRRLVKDAQVGRPKAASIAAALRSFKEADFADPQLRTAYRELRTLQMNRGSLMPRGSAAGLSATSKGGQSKVRGFAPDLRSFRPDREMAFTRSGYPAGFSRFMSGSKWEPAFKHWQSVVPCIERLIRTEVLFALGKGGIGYRTRKRRTWSSGVPC